MPKTKFIGRSHPEENERIPKRDTGRPIQRGEKIQLFRELVALEKKSNKSMLPPWIYLLAVFQTHPFDFPEGRKPFNLLQPSPAPIAPSPIQ